MIVLDTHIWVRWLAGQSDPLLAPLMKAIESADDLCVSAVSWWEVAMLVKRGRMTLPLPLQEWCLEATIGSDIATVPLTAEIALRSVELSDQHRDPADRFILASALVQGARLATLDAAIARYPEAQSILVRE